MTRVPEAYRPSWPRSLGLIRLLDEIGLEAMVTASVWRGAVFGDGAHPSHMEFEPFTWSAALGSASRQCALVATFHTQLANPAFVAKAAATIDHVTGGRFGVNIVAGASKVTHGVFGRQIEDHATRYEHTTAFMEVLRRFWDETEEFDLENDFYSVSNGISVPKPIQRPRPAVMNAAVSERGQQFAAKYADLALTMLKVAEPDVWRKQIGAYRALAWGEHRRTLQIWTHGYLIVRDTAEEAAAYLRRYAETHVDDVWLQSWVRELSEGAPTLRPEQVEILQRHWAAGGGYPLVGTPDQVVETMLSLSEAGLDGILLTALEPEDMLDRLASEVLPRLEQAGVRRSYAARVD